MSNFYDESSFDDGYGFDAGYNAGIEDERAAIVAWLRHQGKHMWAGDVLDATFDYAALDIESGAHLRGDDE